MASTVAETGQMSSTAVSCISVYIQLYSPSRQPQNIEQLYRKKEKNKQISHSQHSHIIRRDIGLHLTDRPVYLNSLQSPFLDVKYFCIKLCRLFSATCLTDSQLNNCILSAIPRENFVTIFAHFGIESVENLIADRRNRFINRYGETDNYLCQMLR